MSIIIISSDTIETEEMIGRAVAGAMGWQPLDRGILADIVGSQGATVQRLLETLNSTPSLFKNISARQWRKELACIEAGVLERLLEDNIVCWGLAAHLYVTGVSHAMKVRVLSENSQKVMKISEEQGISLEKAEKYRAGQLLQRKKWSLAAYGQDETDLSRYDLAINLDQIAPGEAVNTITGAAAYRKFQVMTYSRKCLSDLALAAKVNAVLLQSMTDVRVRSRDGAVVVFTKTIGPQKRKKIAAIKELAGRVDGVGYVEVHVQNLFRDKEKER